MARSGNPTQALASIIGLAYLAIGVIGFIVTGFGGFVDNGDKALLGFALNPFHNVVHLGIGGYLLLVSRASDPSVTEGALIGGGLVYILAAFLGFINHLQILSINSAADPDNFLHLISGAAAVFIGLAGAAARKPAY